MQSSLPRKNSEAESFWSQERDSSSVRSDASNERDKTPTPPRSPVKVVERSNSFQSTRKFFQEQGRLIEAKIYGEEKKSSSDEERDSEQKVRGLVIFHRIKLCISHS